MPRLPRRFAPFVFGIIQSGITTGLATAIASYGAYGMTALAVKPWLMAWGLAWFTMLPVVIGIAPLLQRAVNAVVEPEPSGAPASDKESAVARHAAASGEGDASA